MVHHAAGLRRLTHASLVDALKNDHHTAPITDAERAMLDYALKLNATPAAMVEEDVKTLRDQGFSDSAILDICQVTAYYAFVNRLADGLGVELEDFWRDSPEES